MSATFPIREHDLPPLIKVTGLRALGAIDRLKYTVQQPPSMQLEYARGLSLNRSVHGSEASVSAAWPSVEATIPSLDASMVRHTYLLV